MNLYYVNDSEGYNGWLLIAAETRGQARWNYLSNFENDLSTPLRVRQLAKGVDLPPGELYNYAWPLAHIQGFTDQNSEWLSPLVLL